MKNTITLFLWILAFSQLLTIRQELGMGVSAQEIKFSRDVLPILSDRCFQCHGPDEANRDSDLRLDQLESAISDHGSGPAVTPGDPTNSQLIARIISGDPDQKMPPPDSHRKPLSKGEVRILKEWISNGAKWGRHWAFEVPAKAELPFRDMHPIDAFVKKKLQSQGLDFAPPAPRHTLLRRVFFDLVGIAPNQKQAREFLEDQSEKAYEQLVEKLFQSPHYGERMAMWWLDLARYSDTDGYQQDATRTNWPWRDWVVKSFNRNQPFDQFTIEQFAGDLLPNATIEQKLATCFHRNHMANGEGGRHPEESRIDYVIDRVNTMGTVWLGLTLSCTQCHAHKFDPISHQDYYSLFAFFNSIDEDGKAGGGAKPFLKYTSPVASRDVKVAEAIVTTRRRAESLTKREAEVEFENWLQQTREKLDHSYQAWQLLQPSNVKSVEGTELRIESDGFVQAVGDSLFQDDYKITATPTNRVVTGIRLEVFPHSTHTQGKLSLGKSGEFILTDVKLQKKRKGDSQTIDLEISRAIATAEKKVGGRNYGKVSGTLDDDPRNGWTTESHDPRKPYIAQFALRNPLLLKPEEELIFVMFHRSTNGDSNIGRFRLTTCSEAGGAVGSFEPTPLERLAKNLAGSKTSIDQPLRSLLLNQFLATHSEYQLARNELDRAQRQFNRTKQAAGKLNVMVLAERSKPRKSHVLERGVWDQKGAEVSRAFPAELFGSLNIEANSRLDLAKWLISKKNPMTARVIVNQLWQNCFGTGLVRTPNDFGLQGEFPTHPDLLDWLAVELMEKNWDLQHILRLILTSRTYQQSSHLSVKLQELDPDNRLLARSSRYRLPSWMIRDSALSTSGLLNRSLGGVTVMPYQPDGVWAEIFMGRFRYEPSQGSLQFRRTLYAFWRRSSAPTFLFDNSQRRVCETTPRRTNTPLHALILLNDLSLRESSRRLAIHASAKKSSADQVKYMFLSVLSREPRREELSTLQDRLKAIQTFYQSTPEMTKTYLSFGQPENRPVQNLPQVASLTVLASLIYNLDEAQTRE